MSLSLRHNERGIIVRRQKPEGQVLDDRKAKQSVLGGWVELEHKEIT